MKAYIIMRKGWEYDDSTYSESDGGHPCKIIFNKEEANLFRNLLEISAMKETDISQYSYEIEEELNEDYDDVVAYLKSLNEKYGHPESKNKWESWGELQLNPKATEDEGQTFLKMHNIRFFDVVECEVDQSSLRDYQINQVLS